MSNDLFDYFGGMAERPDDSAEDELDLSDLNLDDSSPTSSAAGAEPDAERAGVSESTSSSTEERPPPATRAESSNRPIAGEEDDVSHWLGLASSLGVAMDSTKFEQSARPAETKRPASAKPAKSSKPKPPRIVHAEEEQVFGKGLIDDLEIESDEPNPPEVLSELFEPPEVRDLEEVEERSSRRSSPVYVDDLEPIVTPEDALDENALDENALDIAFEGGVADEDVIEFEVEELSPGQAASPRRDAPRADGGRGERSRGRDRERGRDRDRGRGRDHDRDRDEERGSRARTEPVGPRREGRAESRGEMRSETPPVEVEFDEAEGIETEPTGRAPDERPRRRRGRRSRGGGQPANAGGEPREPRETRRRPPPITDAVEDADFGELDDESEPESAESVGADGKNVKFPTWAEAIEPIVEANIERHRKNKNRRGGPRRGR